MDLDHVFVLTDPGARHADRLTDIGLLEGPPNDHPGQGTSNRRFFLANSAIELLYVRDAYEANNGTGGRLRFLDRTTSDNASPFGLITRVVSGSSGDDFPGWNYCPDYFQKNQCFRVGENSDLFEEPLCISLPRNLPGSSVIPQPGNPGWILTALEISVPVTESSSTLRFFAKCKGVSLRLNEPHLLKLVINEGKGGRSKNMLPDLPLVIFW
jgi:hypothetical protein